MFLAMYCEHPKQWHCIQRSILTRALYMYVHSLDLAKQVQRLWCRKSRALLTLVVISFTCLDWTFSCKSCERWIPKHLYLASAVSRTLPWSLHWNLNGVCLCVICITFLLGLNSILQADSHFSTLSLSSQLKKQPSIDIMVHDESNF